MLPGGAGAQTWDTGVYNGFSFLLFPFPLYHPSLRPVKLTMVKGGDNVQLNNNIRWRREAKGLTQSELGRQCDVTAAAINRFESGLKVPSLVTAVALAKALGCSLDELVGSASA